MHKFGFHCLLIIAAVHGLAIVAMLTACTTQQKAVARTLNDAATIACHTALGEEAEKQGLKVEDLCAAKEVLQPFLDAILSAQKQAAPAAGLAPAEEPPPAPDGG